MDIQKQIEILSKGTVDVLPENGLKEKLEKSQKENKPLRVKLGIDASGPDIHLGFAIPLRKLRAFQDFGHKAVLIFGDFTGKIGDPTGKNKTRPQLTDDEVKKNLENYKDQVFRILKENMTEIRLNGEWSDALKPTDIVNLTSKFTVARMLERDYFFERYKSGVPISIHEFLYPLFQAYDSVAVKADIELGGTDQKFNLLLGREIQEAYGVEPQIIMTMPLLEGLDGTRKMSKSYGNYIAITESPKEMFGKTMSIPDGLILKYMTLATNMSAEEVKRAEESLKAGDNPRNMKVLLAKKIISLYHSDILAEEAEAEFNRIFKEKGLPDEIEEKSLDKSREYKLTALLKELNLVESSSEASRLIKQGGVKINQKAVTDFNFSYKPESGDILQVGKKKFVKII
ncbi:MAG: tyrosine--tRNA ligase [bacterium]|nr:tyrosine--tRNA ligase [bacterium]